MSLEFYKQIFEDCLNNDSLVVMGKGLGIHNIILGFLKYYSDSSDLVLFIDCSNNESLQNSYLFYYERLINFGLKYANLPTMINQESSGGATKLNMYLKGGVYFGAASIFVLDFLTKRMPCHLVSGIIIQNAHRITDTSIEYLLIKLFRQHNKNGFIKAFTTEPGGLVDEIGKLQRTMRYLHLSKLSLWPRFHQYIASILDAHPPDLVELSISMTDSMKKIEESIKINHRKCISTLIKLNKLPRLDGGGIGMGGDDDVSFESILNLQLKPMWSKLNLFSKQLVSSIKLLNQLSGFLLNYDCVTFYSLLLIIQRTSDSIKETGNKIHQQGGGFISGYVDEVQTWLDSKEAETLFTVARDRVFKYRRTPTLKSPQKKLKVDDTNTTTSPIKSDSSVSSSSSNINDRVLILEDNPKWNILFQVLKEIENDNTRHGTVLVFVKDEKTVQQLHSFLDLGGYTFLLNKYDRFYNNQQQEEERRKERENPQQQTNNSYGSGGGGGSRDGYDRSFMRGRNGRKNFRDNRKQQISETLKKKKNNGSSSSKDPTLFNMGIQVNNSYNNLNVPNPKIVDNQQDQDNNFNINDASTLVSLDEEMNGFNQFYELLSPPYIVIHPHNRSLTILDEIRPTFIIVYDSDISITRQIEVYKAENPGVPVRLYLMIYSDSSEETQYISHLRRESNAFEKLIREKITLIIDTEQHGKIEFDNSKLELLEDTPKANNRNTRLGGIRRAIDGIGGNGGSKNNGKKTIIIDSHEFKSSLPVVLHNHGYEIIPLRLEMGDFVLSPIHCIERKSVSDLIGSFISGRLYNQIEAMNRFYKNPILLIEFDLNHPFYLNPQEELNRDYLSQYATLSKLVMLTKSFPRLRVIWSRSYYSTVKIYDQLKDGQSEPDPNTVNVLPETNDDNYNYNAQDVLRTIPGVNEKNIKNIMDKVDDLYQLSQLSLDKISEIMDDHLNDNKNATLLFNFFNDELPTLANK